jgi:hypothetical protein
MVVYVLGQRKTVKVPNALRGQRQGFFDGLGAGIGLIPRFRGKAEGRGTAPIKSQGIVIQGGIAPLANIAQDLSHGVFMVVKGLALGLPLQEGIAPRVGGEDHDRAS